MQQLVNEQDFTTRRLPREAFGEPCAAHVDDAATGRREGGRRLVATLRGAVAFDEV